MGGTVEQARSDQLATWYQPAKTLHPTYPWGRIGHAGWIQFGQHTSKRVKCQGAGRLCVLEWKAGELWLASGEASRGEGVYFREAPHAAHAQPPRPRMPVHPSIGVQGRAGGDPSALRHSLDNGHS
jgi:hypothetical protein